MQQTNTGVTWRRYSVAYIAQAQRSASVAHAQLTCSPAFDHLGCCRWYFSLSLCCSTATPSVSTLHVSRAEQPGGRAGGAPGLGSVLHRPVVLAAWLASATSSSLRPHRDVGTWVPHLSAYTHFPNPIQWSPHLHMQADLQQVEEAAEVQAIHEARPSSAVAQEESTTAPPNATTDSGTESPAPHPRTSTSNVVTQPSGKRIMRSSNLAY